MNAIKRETACLHSTIRRMTQETERECARTRHSEAHTSRSEQLNEKEPAVAFVRRHWKRRSLSSRSMRANCFPSARAILRREFQWLITPERKKFKTIKQYEFRRIRASPSAVGGWADERIRAPSDACEILHRNVDEISINSSVRRT